MNNSSVIQNRVVADRIGQLYHLTQPRTGAILRSGAENTLESGRTAPVSAVFLCSKSFGVDGPTREDGRMAFYMFSTSTPPNALEKANGDLQTQKGA